VGGPNLESKKSLPVIIHVGRHPEDGRRRTGFYRLRSGNAEKELGPDGGELHLISGRNCLTIGFSDPYPIIRT
jgi:hypothetical protein